MKSANNTTTTTPLLEEDATLTKFRSRHKIIIISFITFFITVTLIIGALTFYLSHDISSEYNSDPYTGIQSIPDPYHVFIPSLQTTTQEIDDLTTSIMRICFSTRDDPYSKAALRNCSISLCNGSGRIRDVLDMVRVNPLSPKNEMMKRIVRAEKDLEACVDYLMKVQESTAVREVMAKVLGVKVRLRSSGDFLSRDYNNVMRGLWTYTAEEWRSMISNNFFNVVICCIQLVFIFFLYWTFCT